jgi:hypothetical protein
MAIPRPAWEDVPMPEIPTPPPDPTWHKRAPAILTVPSRAHSDLCECDECMAWDTAAKGGHADGRLAW